MNIRSLLDKLDSVASYLQSPLLLVIRLYWGWQFAQSGWGKLHNLEKTTGFFESLHIPAPKVNAIAAGSVECFGGVLLALGLFARPVSIPLIFTMIIAYVTADNEALHAITSDPDKFVTATPFLFLLAAAIVLAFGPGKLSLDALFFRKSASGK
jgi:putative oxidoreductase